MKSHQNSVTSLSSLDMDFEMGKDRGASAAEQDYKIGRIGLYENIVVNKLQIAHKRPNFSVANFEAGWRKSYREYAFKMGLKEGMKMRHNDTKLNNSRDALTVYNKEYKESQRMCDSHKNGFIQGYNNVVEAEEIAAAMKRTSIKAKK